jgi:arsenical pump membrane protein
MVGTLVKSTLPPWIFQVCDARGFRPLNHEENAKHDMIVTVGASFMNNWPMTILGLLSIKQATLSGTTLTGLIFSNIIGNNLGPHFFPLGSLAIVIWLETMKRKDVTISLKEYLKVGAVLSIAQVAVASAALWAELAAGFHLML